MQIKFKNKNYDTEWDANRDGSVYLTKIMCECGEDLTDFFTEDQILAIENDYAYEVQLDREIARGEALYDQMKEEGYFDGGGDNKG